jgi:hypothetical protein
MEWLCLLMVAIQRPIDRVMPRTTSPPGYHELSGTRLSKVIWYRAIAAMVATMTAIFALPSALAQPPDAGVKGETAGNQDTSLEPDLVNNGLDITRPQNAIEMRLSGQTSSSGTSETSRVAALLRMNSCMRRTRSIKLS